MTAHFGDWSNHDWGRGAMDFTAMARDGIAGGWHKTTDGLNFYLDPYWPAAIGRMKAAFPLGPYGSYHVLWGNRDLAGQIDWWFSVLDRTAPGWRTDPRFVLVLDAEPFSYNGLPTIGQVNTAGDLITRRVPKVPGAYCPEWVYGTALASLRYPHIASKYGTNPAVRYPAAYPGDGSTRWSRPGGRSVLLQYGSRTVMGSQQTCDADAYTGPASVLLGLLTIGGTTAMSQDFADLHRPIPNTVDWMTGDIAATDLHTLFRIRRTGWQPGKPGDPTGDDAAGWWIVQQIEAQTAGMAGLGKKLDDLTAAFHALAAGGTSLDTAAVIGHIDQRSDEETAVVKQLLTANAALADQVDRLQHALATAAAAEAQALADRPAPPAQP
jgi:hypothetical protein